MCRRSGWGAALIAAFFVVGGGSAWGAGLTIRAAKISGVVRPLGTATVGGHGNITPSFAAPAATNGTSPGGGTPPLLYGGGPLMHAVTTHVVAWAPAGHTFPGGYVSGYEQYLSDLAHDLGRGTNVSSVMAQYVDANGSALSSLTNDAPIDPTDAYPTSGCPLASGASVCLTDAQLENELGAQIVNNGLSTSPDQSYVLLLPPGVDTCADSSGSECRDNYFCGYHSAFYVGSSPVSYTVAPYTDSSYNGAGGCDYATGPGTVSSDLMSLDGIGTHELFESATDPLGDGYLDSGDNEVADECAWYFGAWSSATGGGFYNQLDNGDEYLIQEMWSNQDDACEPGDGPPATASITASPNAAAGTPAAFSASLTGVSVSGASYQWFYALTPSGSPVYAGSGPNPQITFPSAGTYTAWVDVTDAAGGTITGVADTNVVSSTIAPPTSSGSSGSPGSTGSSGSHGPSGQTARTSWLRTALNVAAGQLRIPSLLKNNGITTKVRSAAVTGKLVITWYATIKHRRVVVARGAQTVASRVTAHISMKLTAAGRALLQKSKSLKITAVGSYVFGTKRIRSSRTLTLRQ